ncbi:hypothetical protein [Peribacillus simplex]|uniref:hypothetical protein n=1 Tax=Peribacillus simplex TaxID=1478 RepID=UPI0011A7EF5F|nr:hypothetical protein [Peribacillus simplex]
MSIVLEERTTGHASYKNIESIFQVIDEIYNNSPNILVEVFDKLERIRTTLEFLKYSLDKVDPWLVSINTMNNMNSNVSQILGELSNYKDYRNEGNLNNALDYLEGLITYLSQIVVTKTPEDIEGVRNSVIKFRQSAGQYMAHLEKDATKTSTALTKNTEKLNELTTSIDNQKNRIDSIVSDFQNQFLQTQTQRGQEFDNFIIKGEADLKDVIEVFGQNYELHKSAELAIFNKMKDSYEQQIATQQNTFGSLIEDFKTKVQTEFDQIHAMNKEAEKIVGIISMKGLAHGYQKIANDEGKKAFWWNIGSIISMVAVIVFGVIFLLMHKGTLEWTALVSRIVLTGVGITLFTYCAKQATNHRNEERRNRKIELELASLDPYLKDLEPEKQKEVKQTLVDKYFGVEIAPNAQAQQAPNQQQIVTDTITNNPQLLQLLAEKLLQQPPK